MVKKLRIKKANIKKLLTIIFVITILILLIYKFISKDYEITYKVKEYDITEKYYKKDNYYTFTISKDEIKYHIILDKGIRYAKRIIKDIDEYQTDDEVCIIPKNKKIIFYPECFKNEQISYHIASEKMKEKLQYEEKSQEKKEEHNNMKIYDDIDKNIYIWNYRGFYRTKEKDVVNVFNKDIYSPTLITQINNILFIPNYEDDYYFKEVLLLDMETGKQEKWQLPDSIYFDSTILGVYDNKIYLIDKHEKKELEIDIYKKTVNDINNRIYYRGWQNTTINKLLYQNSLFYGTNPREYIINDNYLYEENENYKKRLTSEKIETIARKYSDSVYYFINNKLYYYDDNQGNVLLIENFEWIFNKDNVIFAIQ